MVNEQAQQAWVGICQFPGRKEFYAGTVWHPVGENKHVIEESLLAEFREVLPLDVKPPTIVKLIPGMLVLIKDKED